MKPSAFVPWSPALSAAMSFAMASCPMYFRPTRRTTDPNCRTQGSRACPARPRSRASAAPRGLYPDTRTRDARTCQAGFDGGSVVVRLHEEGVEIGGPRKVAAVGAQDMVGGTPHRNSLLLREPMRLAPGACAKLPAAADSLAS